MDRIERALVVGLTLGALVALGGAQGARIGSWEVSALSLWWVVAAGALVVMLAPPGATRPSGLGGPGIALGMSLVALLLARSQALHPKTSIDFLVDGERATRASSVQIEHRSVLRRLAGRRRNVALETRALLEVPRSGTYTFHVACDDSCEITLGSETVAIEGLRSIEVPLEKGTVPIEIRYRQTGGPARLAVAWDTPRFLEPLPIDYYLRSPGSEPRSRWPAHLALAGFAVWFVVLGVYLVRLGRARAQWMAQPAVPLVLALLVALYGTLLRLEAFLAHSGLAERDDRLSLVHEALVPVLPDFGVLHPENAPDDPYRADVRSYLDRAASMSTMGFYAPSFREPFYVLLTFLGVSLAGGEIGILIQSLVFSCLTLPLFWLVAWKLHGLWWATLLLVPVSLHEWLVLEAPTGYRMSAYSFFLVVFVALAIRERESPRAAATEGVASGVLALIRLSALSAIAPVLALRLFPLPRPKRFAAGLAFALALSIVVGPFLLSNYRAYSDPLYSVSFHTEFWLRAEGLDRGQGPVGLTSYFSDFGRAGALVKGTVLGLTALPLRTFWNGLRFLPALGLVTLALGTLGLLMLGKSVNRFLAAAYFGHLLPFAYIQNFPSGEMPRFVMPAYFFLVLAVPAAASVVGRRIFPDRGVASVEPPPGRAV